MTQLEREYFNTFTLKRLKAFYNVLSNKKANFSSDVDYDGKIYYHGWSYVTRKWLRPGGKVIEIKINKRKVRNAIKERENYEKTLSCNSRIFK